MTTSALICLFQDIVRRIGDEDAFMGIVLADIAEAEFIEAAVS
jgi:hypothetical protein